MHDIGKDGSAGKEVVVKDDNHKRPENAPSATFAPPDGGYGWVIVFASFCSNVIVDGIIFTTGEALVGIWEQDFKSTAMQASIAQSLLTGFYLLAGPLASALANLFGCRLVTIGGALVTFTGFILSSFVSSLPFLYISFGVIGGIGFGLAYLPSIVIVNQYFDKRRALAMGIAVCGSGIGTTIFSQILPFLLKFCNNNWRSSLVYVAFVILLLILCALCYRRVPSDAQIDDEGNGDAQQSNASGNKDLDKRNTAPGRITNVNVYQMFYSNTDLRATFIRDKKAKSDFDLSKFFDSGYDQNASPLTRPDIFYPSSMSSLQERLSRRGMPKAKNTLVMTSTVTTKVVPQQAKQQPSLRDILRSMVDLSLLKNPSFLLIAITGFLTLCCLFVPFIFLGKQAVKVGATPRQQSFLVLSLGVVNILGRIFCGLISDFPSVDPLVVHNAAIIIGGLATCCVPLLTQYWMYIVYTIPFAWGVACFSALRSIICVELLGLEKLSNAYGMMMLCMGIAALIGPPIAALLKDLSGNFDLSFYLMGTMLTLSGVLCIPLRRVNSNPSASTVVELEPEPIVENERF